MFFNLRILKPLNFIKSIFLKYFNQQLLPIKSMGQSKDYGIVAQMVVYLYIIRVIQEVSSPHL